MLLMMSMNNLDKVTPQDNTDIKFFANGQIRVDVKNLNFGAEERSENDE